MQPAALSKAYVAINRQCPIKSSNRSIRLFELNKRFGLAQQRVCEIAIERQRPTVSSQSIVVLLQMQKDTAAADPGLGEVGSERKRTVIGGQRPRMIAEHVEY